MEFDAGPVVDHGNPGGKIANTEYDEKILNICQINVLALNCKIHKTLNCKKHKIIIHTYMLSFKMQKRKTMFNP